MSGQIRRMLFNFGRCQINARPETSRGGPIGAKLEHNRRESVGVCGKGDQQPVPGTCWSTLCVCKGLGDCVNGEGIKRFPRGASTRPGGGGQLGGRSSRGAVNWGGQLGGATRVAREALLVSAPIKRIRCCNPNSLCHASPAQPLDHTRQPPPGLAAQNTGCTDVRPNWRLESRHGSPSATFDQHRSNRYNALRGA